jgi:hypothetical protein
VGHTPPPGALRDGGGTREVAGRGRWCQSGRGGKPWLTSEDKIGAKVSRRVVNLSNCTSNIVVLSLYSSVCSLIYCLNML